MAFNRLEVNDLATATLDDSDQVIVGESNTYKKATVSALKNNILGTSPTYTTDTEPYLMRQAANIGVVGKCALNKLVGGSLGWNQLVQALSSSWTSESGVTATYSNGVATIASTAANNGIKIAASSVVVGHKYLLTFAAMSSNSYEIRFGYTSASGIQMKGQTTSSWKTFASVKNALATHSQVYIYGTTAYSGVQVQNAMILDLTQMFGSTIADYIYSLEAATEGSGIAWLSKYIDLGTYHAYDAGSIQSVQATAHVTTGFNQFDEVVEAGYWDTSTGQKASGGSWMRCANYIPVLPNTEYKIHFTSGSGSQGNIIYLDGNKSVISYISSYISAVITTPSNCRYMVFYANNGWFGGNICINISKTTGSPKNGDYVPYNGHIYPLGSDTLRGYPMLVNNKLAFDGDIRTPDGTTRRRYGTVDLGTLNWGYATNYGGAFYANVPSEVANNVAGGLAGVCGRYALFQGGSSEFTNADKVFSLCNQNFTSLKRIQLKDSAYTDQATFKASVSGVYLVYPLATETTESSTAFQKIQTIDADGTESFTTSSPVPVGHETQTADNILAALSWVGE